MLPTSPRRALDTAGVRAALGAWASGPDPLNVQLARSLRRAVQRGDLPPGARLPAERELASALSVSRGTVVVALSALREEGWLASREGSGTWVRTDSPAASRALRGLPGALGGPSDAGASARRMSGRLFDRDDSVVDLAISSVRDLDGVPESAFASLTAPELLREGQVDGYQPFGSPRLRAAIADRYTASGLPTSADEVLVTCGAQQALALAAAAVLRPGEAAVLESPTYPGAIDTLARTGARLVSVPAQGLAGAGWTEALAATVRTSGARVVYLMPACHNPLGTVMSEARRRAVAELADSLGVHVIADDLMELLTDVRQPRPLAAFSTTGRVITIGSLSKVVWGGLRVGWLRGPADVVAQLGRTRAAADYGMSVVSQVIAGRILPDLDAVAASRRRQFSAARALVTDLLARELPEWRVNPAQGGMSLWVQIPVGSADALEQHAQRAGVAITPGSVHSVDPCSASSHLRLSCSQPPEVLAEGVARLARAWRAHLAAIDQQLVRPPTPRGAGRGQLLAGSGPGA